MTQKKKTTLIIVAVLIIAGGAGLFYVVKGGFTAKQRYNKCAETCEELMFNESNIPQCKLECEDITGYNPTAKKEETSKQETTNTSSTTTTNTSINTSVINTSTVNTNTSSTNSNINTEDYEDREYYCNWVWYQEIIDNNTKELIYECTSSYPWCNSADRTFENVGCCSDKEHTDCITLPNLL